MNKVVDIEAAVADIQDGASIAVGGFGLVGVPTVLLEAVRARGVTGLTAVSNNCGVADAGLGVLINGHQITRMVASYVGENSEFVRQYLAGDIEVEFTPQGTLAEKLRAGGCGIPAFYTLAGVGTWVAEGGVPQRFRPDGSVGVESSPKETRAFDGVTYVLETSITTDFALVRAARADPAGNLVFHSSARNFNPLCAMAGRITIVEAEEIVDIGELDPDEVHLPGVFVQRIVGVPKGTEKRIEKLNLRPSSIGTEK